MIRITEFHYLMAKNDFSNSFMVGDLWGSPTLDRLKRMDKAKQSISHHMKQLKTTSLSDENMVVLHLHHCQCHGYSKTPTYINYFDWMIFSNMCYIHPGRHFKLKPRPTFSGPAIHLPPTLFVHVSLSYSSQYRSLVTPCLPLLFHTFLFSFHLRYCITYCFTRSLPLTH
jgi:hypothetical protein